MEDRLKRNIPESDAEIARVIVNELPWTEEAKTGHLAKRYWEFLTEYSYLEDIRLSGDYTISVDKLREYFSPSGGAPRRPDEPDISLKHATADQERLLREARQIRLKAQLDERPDVVAFQQKFNRLQWLGKSAHWNYRTIESALHAPILAALSFDILESILSKMPTFVTRTGAIAALNARLSIRHTENGKRWYLTRELHRWDVSKRSMKTIEVASGDWIDAQVLAMERVAPGAVDRVQGCWQTQSPTSTDAPKGIWGLCGSVLGDALLIAQDIANHNPLTVQDGLTYLLTGKIKPRPIIQVMFTTMPFDLGPHDYPATAAGPVVLVVDPFVSPDGLQTFWSDYQELLYGDHRDLNGDTKRFRWRAPSLTVLDHTLADLRDRPKGRLSGRRRSKSGVARSTTKRRLERVERAAMPIPYYLQEGDLRELMEQQKFLKEMVPPDAELEQNWAADAQSWADYAQNRADYARIKANTAPTAAKEPWLTIAGHWQRIADSLHERLPK